MTWLGPFLPSAHATGADCPPRLLHLSSFLLTMVATTSSRARAGLDGSKNGSKQRTYPVLARREVEALIAEGRTIIIVEQHVLKVDAWRQYHPGGDKAILHMVGRDATDEVNWFVPPRRAAQIAAIMRCPR